MEHDNTCFFTDPRIQYPSLATGSFEQYISACRQLIADTRLDLQTHTNHIIDANTPYEYYPSTHTPGKKYRRGILLIHGLLDSPFIMRDLGQALTDDNTIVKSILLPGHGTIPGALLNVHFMQWVTIVQQATAFLANEVDHVYLAGYSTGASLSLYQALTQPAIPIRGVILLSPAFKINHPFAFLAQYPARLGHHWPRAAWFHLDTSEGADYTKYRSIAFNAAYQVYLLANAIKHSPAPMCSLFMALAANDMTVTSQDSINYFKRYANTHSRMIIYHPDSDYFDNDSRIMVRSSRYPALNIQDFSHISIPTQSNNPHYGELGDCIDASHVTTNNQTQFGEYSDRQIAWQRFLVKHGLAQHYYQRLSFNPDFDFMRAQIKQFIETV